MLFSKKFSVILKKERSDESVLKRVFFLLLCRVLLFCFGLTTFDLIFHRISYVKSKINSFYLSIYLKQSTLLYSMNLRDVLNQTTCF